MTVSELIEKLKKLDPNARLIGHEKGTCWDCRNINAAKDNYHKNESVVKLTISR